VLIISVTIALYFIITNIKHSAHFNQITMTIEGRPTNVKSIPFPAITITDKVQFKSKNTALAVYDSVLVFSKSSYVESLE
jgi:hypothetical protein